MEMNTGFQFDDHYLKIFKYRFYLKIKFGKFDKGSTFKVMWRMLEQVPDSRLGLLAQVCLEYNI